MPVVHIEALINTRPDIPNLLRETAKALALALGIDESHCWVTFREIPPGSYYEGGKVREADDAPEVSPLVTIRAYQGRSLEQKAAALRAVAEAVGKGLGSDPANVFVEYREIMAGHIFTGGELR